MSKYEPKVGDWVRVVKCLHNNQDHVGKIGRLDTETIQWTGSSNVAIEGVGLCAAAEVGPATPPAAEVFAQATCDCAEFRRLLLEEITKDVTADPSLALEVLALVHARRKNGKGERDAAQ